MMPQFGPPRPDKRGRTLREILKDADESEEQMLAHPIYKQGYDDGYEKGYAEALENHRQLTAALAATYRIDRFGQ